MIKMPAVALLCYSAIFLLAFSVAKAQTFTTHSNLAYVGDGNTRHLLDLYVPDGATTPVPLIIWIHGGGWQNGDKTLGPNSFQLRYARNGYAVASLNYRLSSEAIFPAQIHDVKAAIRWLRANSSTYGIDPTKFGVWGSSAGGHLAALAGTSNDVDDLEGTLGERNASSRVQAVVDWYGPTDFLLMDSQLKANPACGFGNHDAANSPESLLVGCSIQTCPQAVQRANPLTYASIDDPAFFIEHGSVDCTVPDGQSNILLSRLSGLGLNATFTSLIGAGHGGPQFSAESNLLLVDAFWSAQLRAKNHPLLTSIRVFRKSREVTTFLSGSLGRLYRIELSGLNIAAGSTIIVNGEQRTVRGPVPFVTGGPVGRIPLAGAVKIQIKSADGLYSNVISVPVSSD